MAVDKQNGDVPPKPADRVVQEYNVMVDGVAKATVPTVEAMRMEGFYQYVVARSNGAVSPKITYVSRQVNIDARPDSAVVETAVN